MSQRMGMVIGLKPEKIAQFAVHEGELRVSITEPLGNETLVFVEFAGKEWVARMLNPRHLNSGEAVSMHFDLSQAHLFDAASGKSLAV